MFIDKPFTSHSGLSLNWKINIDCLTPEDLQCIAKVIARQFSFREVHGVDLPWPKL